MVLFNYATKEITAKIVYYGPGLCGKTTNLQFVYDSLPSNNKSKMLSLATKTDRTLFFDFLPLDLGKIRGMRTKLQLYTVPGQVYYNSTRQLVLKGADGLVFVADSQDFALDANLESLQNLEDNLKRQGIKIREIPVVLQWNKRDLPNVLPVEELNREVNRLGVPSFESVATTGIGVEETLKGITQLVLTHLVRKYGLESSEPLDREIQILNARVPGDRQSDDSLWDEDEESAPALPPPVPASNSFVVDDDSQDDDIPLIQTELIDPPPASAAAPVSKERPAAAAAPARQQESPFTDVSDYFHTPGPAAHVQAPPVDSPFGRMAPAPIEVPFASIEIPLPPGILDSLPNLEQPFTPPVTAPWPESPAAPVPPPVAQTAADAAAAERRASDGLVKEVNIPLNLSVAELRQHRRLRLKITLDVNLLP